MKLLFRQRFLSWFDSYDVYDEAGETVFTVKGQLAWGHCFHIYDRNGNFVGKVKEKILTFLPRFEVYAGDTMIGSIRKKLTLFSPSYDIDFNGWHVEGDILEWNYRILDAHGNTVAAVYKKLLAWTDTYIIDVANEKDALAALMFAIAMDAEKCSRKDK